ncbi:MAG: hypothetical protein ABEJ89_06510 [Haloarculaceae archaeon]
MVGEPLAVDCVNDLASTLVVEYGTTPRTDACLHLLDDGPALVVSYGRGPNEIARAWASDGGGNRLRVLSAGVADADDLPDQVTVEAFASEDLASIGIALDEWLRTEGGHADASVCLGAVDGLLSAVDRATAFRFLHALCARVARTDVRVHAHVGAGDRRALTTVAPLFDRVLSHDGESWHRREPFP